MKKILLALVLIHFLATSVFAGNILYVDTPPAESGSDWDGTNGHSYTGAPGAGTGYGTVNAALDAMSSGDDIYLRGGTYTETGSANEAFEIHVDGSSSDWCSIQSYPGEWAILDADRARAATIGQLGYRELWDGSPNQYIIEYWIFERLGITGATNCGMWLNRGPYEIRYCYIYDNYAADGGDNPGGIEITLPKDSTIEFNVFSGNGSTSVSNNSTQIKFSCDQAYSVGDCNKATALSDGICDADNITTNNTVRYNYFLIGATDRTQHAFMHKAPQIIQPRAVSASMVDAYKNYGDKIHHNIVIGDQDIQVQQDFAQVYQNIIAGGMLEIGYRISVQAYYVVAYNNYSKSIQYGHGTPYETYYFWETNDVLEQRGWAYNNISDDYSSGFAYRDLSFRANTSSYAAWAAEQTHDLDQFYFKNNYIYRGDDVAVWDAVNGEVSLAAFESAYAGAENNYEKASSEGSDNLMTGESGADLYTPRSAHVVSGSTTIGNGGVGGAHPYLSGVTIPSYIGPVNPDDTAWVAGVMAMDATYFTSAVAGSEPSWIEGSASSASSTSPRYQGMTFRGMGQ